MVFLYYIRLGFLRLVIYYKLDDNPCACAERVLIIMFVYEMILTFCNTTIFIDYKMTNTNVGILNISLLFKS